VPANTGLSRTDRNSLPSPIQPSCRKPGSLHNTRSSETDNLHKAGIVLEMAPGKGLVDRDYFSPEKPCRLANHLDQRSILLGTPWRPLQKSRHRNGCRKDFFPPHTTQRLSGIACKTLPQKSRLPCHWRDGMVDPPNLENNIGLACELSPFPCHPKERTTALCGHVPAYVVEVEPPGHGDP